MKKKKEVKEMRTYHQEMRERERDTELLCLEFPAGYEFYIFSRLLFYAFVQVGR